jgi:hypothetical protein
MIVVSNTSPITNLAAIGQFHLLPHLYTHLHIAHGVWEELQAGGQHWPGYDQVSAADWITTHTVGNNALVTALRRDLDSGEAESIALALEPGAEWVLMDEREGRHAAQRPGLRVIGVIGILLEAKATDQIEHITPFLEKLRHEAGFYLSDTLAQKARELAGE